MIYEIFRKCFPELTMSEEVFNELAEVDKCICFVVHSGSKTVGTVLIKENEIRLICVIPEYQRKGFGRGLLKMAEGAASNYGTRVFAGSPRSRLFIGVPEETAGFFEKYGYSLGGTVAEMSGDTAQITEAEFPSREDIRFELRRADEKVREAVKKVEEDWVQYFDEGEVYCGIYNGGEDDEIVSFCTVEDNVTCLLSGEGKRIGSIGCVGTVPAFRRQGIGLKTVSLAAEELKRRGCDKIFIHYTHVYDWYARLGFKSFLRLKMGSKPHYDCGCNFED